MDWRRFPRLVAPGGRLGRRLSRDAARQAGPGADRARRHRRADCAVAARSRRADGDDLRRFRSDDRARHDALAASALLRLFPGQRRAGLGGRRVSGLGDGRAMHAVADLAGRDRARDENDRLAAPGARPAGRLLRRDPGFGLVGDAGRRADHAREGARLGRQRSRPGRRSRRFASIAPDQVHTSIDRAIWVAGIGEANLVQDRRTPGRCAAWMPPRSRPRSSPTRRRACLPAGIIASVGGTSVGGTDDVAAVAAVARRHGLYLHVDAAWAGSAMICPEFRHFWAGVEAADSIVFNPHKWLGAQFDCSIHFVRDPDSLVRTLAIRPGISEDARQGRHRQLFGMDGAARTPLPRAEAVVPAARAWARRPARDDPQPRRAGAASSPRGCAATPGFEIVSEPMLSLFSFRHAPPAGVDADRAQSRSGQRDQRRRPHLPDADPASTAASPSASRPASSKPRRATSTWPTTSSPRLRAAGCSGLIKDCRICAIAPLLSEGDRRLSCKTP